MAGKIASDHTMFPRLVIMISLAGLLGPGSKPFLGQSSSQNSGNFTSDTVIKLADRGCELKIDANGIVSFAGESFDFDITSLRSHITTKEFGQLVSVFNKIDFFSLHDHYRDREDGCPKV